jgi:alpha-beta hydrolase superfamily lysophospholipase
MADILLVHGAWHGPWCWGNFAQRLALRGHGIKAVELRGHDRSQDRIWHRLRDYVEDVARAAAGFPAPPVLVGHSLGGLIVQKYLERHTAPGGVLMGSIPTGGTIGAVIRLLRRHPAPWIKTHLLFRLKPFVGTPELVRELFFTPNTSQSIVDTCFSLLCDESYLAFIDTMIAWPRPHRVRAPMLVLGAEEDAFFTLHEVRRTAHAYQTEAEIFSGMGHDMMLDTDWRKVADRIDAWISETSAPGR